MVNPALEQGSVDKPAVVESLFDALTAPASVKRLCDFIAVMSQASGNPTATQMNPNLDKLAFKPTTTNPTRPLSAHNRLSHLLEVSATIEHYLQSNPLGEEVVKFKLLLSYTMLYLTLEKGIVPAMVADNPGIGDQEVDRKKLPVFQAQLAKQGVNVKQVTLRERIRYGKVLWTMVTMGGVLMLPMLAVAGPGISILAHNFGVTTNTIPVLASCLAESNIWMAMCQALAPVVVELIFSRCCQRYSPTDLLQLLVLEPLQAFPIHSLYQHCLQQPSLAPFNVPETRLYRLPAKLTHKLASQMLSQFGLEIAMFPTNKYPNPTSHQVRIVEWLLLTDENQVITLPFDTTTSLRTGVETKLAVFTSLLEPAHIADEVVHFLSRLWTQRGLPGWAIISPLNTIKALEGSLGDDPKTAFSLAAGGRRLNVAFQHFVFPIATNQLVLPLIVSPRDCTATLFVLVGSDATLECATKLLQVCTVSFK